MSLLIGLFNVCENVPFCVVFCLKMGSLLGGAGGGHGGLWWRPFESQKRQGRRRRSSKPSDSVDRTTSGGGYRFPLKQALTAGSLAFAGDTIAQLSERYRKRNSLSDSDSDSGFSKVSMSLVVPAACGLFGWRENVGHIMKLKFWKFSLLVPQFFLIIFLWYVWFLGKCSKGERDSCSES